jgi:hypothetical protein
MACRAPSVSWANWNWTGSIIRYPDGGHWKRPAVKHYSSRQACSILANLEIPTSKHSWRYCGTANDPSSG